MGFIQDLLQSAGQTATSGALGIGIGAITGAMNDERQRNMQEWLMKQQIMGQKEMGQFNQQLAYDMWKKTGFAGQVEQINKAGFNPALMVGSGGQAGSTAFGGGSVNGGNAPTGGGEILGIMQMANQNALLKAQKENIEADTELKKTEMPVKVEDARGRNMANNWEEWKQSHNENGYRVEGNVAYDTDGKVMENENGKTWKESENKMAYDRMFNEIDGIIKQNALTAKQTDEVTQKIAELGKKIDLLTEQKLSQEQITENLKKDGSIKDFEIEMNKIGLTHTSISDIIRLIIHKL